MVMVQNWRFGISCGDFGCGVQYVGPRGFGRDSAAHSRAQR